MPGWCQAIVWTSAGIFLIRILGTNFSEILSVVQAFPCLDVLTWQKQTAAAGYSLELDRITSMWNILYDSLYNTKLSSVGQRQNRNMFLNSHKSLQFLTLMGKIWAVGSEYLTHWVKMAVIFVDDIFKCIFWNDNAWISIKISLTFVPKNPINNIPALAQIMARRRQAGKPLFEAMMVRLPTHTCVTRP